VLYSSATFRADQGRGGSDSQETATRQRENRCAAEQPHVNTNSSCAAPTAIRSRRGPASGSDSAVRAGKLANRSSCNSSQIIGRWRGIVRPGGLAAPPRSTRLLAPCVETKMAADQEAPVTTESARTDRHSDRLPFCRAGCLFVCCLPGSSSPPLVTGSFLALAGQKPGQVLGSLPNVANNGPNSFQEPGGIAIYDRRTGGKLGRFAFVDSHGGTPNLWLAIALLPDGIKAHAANERDGAVYVLDSHNPGAPEIPPGDRRCAQSGRWRLPPGRILITRTARPPASSMTSSGRAWRGRRFRSVTGQPAGPMAGRTIEPDRAAGARPLVSPGWEGWEWPDGRHGGRPGLRSPWRGTPG
jgi:hypothetical protein